MKLLKVLELSAALLLMLLLKLCHNNVEALAKEDLAMENVKDIDFYKRSIHSDAFDVDAAAGRAKNGTTSLTLSQHDEKEDNDNGNTKVHSRGKRFIAFPVGSSFSTAVCMTTGVIGNPNEQYLSLGLNWGIAYELPNSTWVLQHANGFGVKEEILGPQIKRRHRRDLYGKLETLMDGMGYNGRDCILRALCESRQYFQKTKMGMIGEMLRVMFSLPKQRIFTRELDENSDIELYDRAYRKARSVEDCSEQYKCSFSLLELAFGKYSSAPEGYYGQH